MPEVKGFGTLFSADVNQDQKMNMSYYVVRISLTAEETAHLTDLD
ncbi:MAG: hypothetical protein ACJAVZ_002539 [Afipia broomeae]|jgi:hypothetical protein